MRALRHLAQIVLLTVSILALPYPAMAASDIVDLQVTQKQLKELQDRMQSLQGRLNNARGEQSKLQAELGRTERRINTLLGQIRKLEADIAASQKRLAELKTREQSLQSELDQHKTQLAEQIRASYTIGQDSSLRMLLKLDSLQESERMMSYYSYFNRARSERINSYLVLLDELKQTREAMAAENAALLANREKLAGQQQALTREQRSQKQTLAKLNQEIRSGESQLKQMTGDQKRLEALVKEVEQALADIHMPPGGSTEKRAFREMRAKLSWPVRGKLLKQFGVQPDRDGIRWNGIFIQSDAGTAVKAVHPGRVVFADWLRGFGLLLIVDHGQGYMSLYGSSQAIYKQPGDWVNAGETIASTGSSGGQPDSGLYFEIRHKGEPQNPINWLAK